MMHRSKKLLCSGDEEYFNEKRSVKRARRWHSTPRRALSRAQGVLTNTSHHGGSVRVVGNSYLGITSGLLVILTESLNAAPRPW
jgi:hypothetical protein